ncbi:hypothetical protein [Litoreibacter halocynthiae]|uniref:hypothetical protein n=1 Tax=Litoreibacter halocynthiae TaxID=1242689 RepID=UPI0013C3005C|nr:hypothetical protein [Litoreibacter halocynthiae]
MPRRIARNPKRTTSQITDCIAPRIMPDITFSRTICDALGLLSRFNRNLLFGSLLSSVGLLKNELEKTAG